MRPTAQPLNQRQIRALAVTALLSAVVMTGCPSLSTLQTVDTVPEGQTRFALGAEAVGAEGAAAPQIEFAVRHGLSDTVDIGGKVYLGGLELGVKVQVMDSDWDMSIAPATSFIYVKADDEGVGVLYLHAPLLIGTDFSDTLSIGFGPKFLYALFFGDIVDDDFAVDGLMGGAYVNLPIRVSQSFWIAPEVNVYTPFTGDASFDTVLWQGGIGFLFGGGEGE